MPELHVVNHPLVSHKLTQMRRTETPSERFRQLLTETSLLLAYEVTRELPLRSVRITTPMTDTDQPELVEEPVVVSILRAGNGLLDGVLRVIPSARVGHVGLYRDHETLEAVEYYCKLPPLEGRTVIVVAAPEGIAALQDTHPDVAIWTAAVDECLNEVGYIVPGLGDAGDRIFGTS